MSPDKLFNIVTLWVRETFGKKRSNIMIIQHLFEELDELDIAVDNHSKGFSTRMEMLNEFANMQILLWNLADNNGVCFDALMDAVVVKHKVNINHRWVIVNGKMKRLPDELDILEQPKNQQE